MIQLCSRKRVACEVGETLFKATQEQLLYVGGSLSPALSILIQIPIFCLSQLQRKRPSAQTEV